MKIGIWTIVARNGSRMHIAQDRIMRIRHGGAVAAIGTESSYELRMSFASPDLAAATVAQLDRGEDFRPVFCDSMVFAKAENFLTNYQMHKIKEKSK